MAQKKAKSTHMELLAQEHHSYPLLNSFDSLATDEKMSSFQRDFFEKMIEQYHTSLSVHAHHLIGSEDAAQDIVQETWIAFCYQYLQRQPLSWFEHVHVSALLRMIAKNKAHDYHDKFQKHTISLDIENVSFLFEPHVPPFEYPENAAIRADVCLLLYQAVNALKHPEHEVIALRFFYDYSLKAIAQTLDLRLNTVKSHLRRGESRLRTILLAQGVVTSDIRLWDTTDETFPKVVLRE